MTKKKKKTDRRRVTEFTENNSGGGWWLTKKDYDKLEKAGWVREEWDIDLMPHSLRNHGTWQRPYGMYYEAPLEESIALWETITGKNAEEPGCSCCGQPYNFYAVDHPDDE